MIKIKELKELVCNIVERTCELKDKHTDEKSIPVHYVAIFTHTQKEYDELVSLAGKIGSVLKTTPTGPLFKIEQIDTVAGHLKILKIRIPDITRPERGDADYAVRDYNSFKTKYLLRPGFRLITRDKFEMIELMDSSFDVRVYFSNPPVEKQYGLS